MGESRARPVAKGTPMQLGGRLLQRYTLCFSQREEIHVYTHAFHYLGTAAHPASRPPMLGPQGTTDRRS